MIPQPTTGTTNGLTRSAQSVMPDPSPIDEVKIINAAASSAPNASPIRNPRSVYDQSGFLGDFRSRAIVLLNVP